MKNTTFNPRKLAIFLFLALLLSLTAAAGASPVGAAEAGVNLVISPSTRTVSPGDSFTITVQAECGSQTIDGVELYLDFDPAYLAVQSAQAGSSLSIVLMHPVFDNAAGTFGFSAGQLSGPFPDGTFTVVTITFQALIPTSTAVPVSFHTSGQRTTLVDWGGQEVTGELIGGSYSIASISPSKTGSNGGSGGHSDLRITLSGFVVNSPLSVTGSGVLLSSAELSSADGKVKLNISRGTSLLTAANGVLTSLSIAPDSNPPPPPDGQAVVLAYGLSPGGARFAPEINVTFVYTPADLPAGVSESDLFAVYHDGVLWQKLENVLNLESRSVSCSLAHFSTLALLGEVSEPVLTSPAPASPTIPTLNTLTAASSTTAPAPSSSVSLETTPQITSTPSDSSLTPLPASSGVNESPASSQHTVPWLTILVVTGGLALVLVIVFILARGRKKGPGKS